MSERITAKEWEKEIKMHEVFHIQDWERATLIPGRTKIVRINYIFDATDGIALVKNRNNRIALINTEKEIGHLRKILKHPKKSAEKGIFARRLQFHNPSSHLMDLLLFLKQDINLSNALLGERKSEDNWGKIVYIIALLGSIIEEK